MGQLSIPSLLTCKALVGNAQLPRNLGVVCHSACKKHASPRQRCVSVELNTGTLCGLSAAPGLQARLVHEQLSTHWRGALQHQLQQALNSGGGGTAGDPAAVPGGSGLSKLATHMQALGLGAVTAEVQEGQPGRECLVKTISLMLAACECSPTLAKGAQGN